MKTKRLLATVVVMVMVTSCQTNRNETPNRIQGSDDLAMVRHKTKVIDGLDIFYREAGDSKNPTILFLHGFPSSSHMYRDIMNDLSSRYHVIAPDYPGFGLSSAPPVDAYAYTFDNVSITIDHFIDALNLKNISLYLQDYGGPVGFRIAYRRPELINSLIIQNANAYSEGLGEAAGPLVAYFRNPNSETQEGARGILTTTKWQYTDGAEDISKVSPDSYLVDQFFLDRAGNDDIQLALFRDYGSNLALYDSWHEYFRQKQPRVLVIWGKNDKIFITPGAEAYKRDLPNAEIHLLNGGHFLLEEFHNEAARKIDAFLSRSRQIE